MKLCNNHHLKIANGQTTGDREGSYTCFNRGAASVVDYLLVENSIHKKVENLKILLPEFNSKHTPITATFRIQTTNNSIGKLLNPTKAYKWDSQGATIFSSLINCKDSKMKMKTISEASERNKSIQNLEKATKTLTEFITNCANKSLKLKRQYKTNRKHNKSGYNETCANLKKQLKQASSLSQKNPKNINIINHYQKIGKKYKYTIKIQKQKWEEKNIKKLETLMNNPKQFWQHLKTLRESTIQ